jgi:hypothetical protein
MQSALKSSHPFDSVVTPKFPYHEYLLTASMPSFPAGLEEGIQFFLDQ